MTREMSLKVACYSYDRVEFGISVLQFVYLLADAQMQIYLQ